MSIQSRCTSYACGVIAVAFLTLASPLAAAAKELRLGLVITNQLYTMVPEVPPLTNPHRDGEVIVAALRDVNFDVPPHRARSNLERAQMAPTIKEFVDAVRAAVASKAYPGGVIAFIYYSGHGASDGNGSFAIPVDAPVRHQEDLAKFAINLQSIVDEMSDTGARSIIVIDACRNLLPKSPTKGLRPVIVLDREQGGRETLVAYAAADGQVANDDHQYARILAEKIRTPGLSHRTAFIQLKWDVWKLRGGKPLSAPFSKDEIYHEFVFRAKAEESIPDQYPREQPKPQPHWQITNTVENATIYFNAPTRMYKAPSSESASMGVMPGGAELRNRSVQYGKGLGRHWLKFKNRHQEDVYVRDYEAFVEIAPTKH